MKKVYMFAIATLGISIMSGAASVVTITKALPKLDGYLVERRADLLSDKTIFQSKDKVNKISIGNTNIAYNTIVNIKKSKDNEVRVNATLINGKNYYKTDVKNGVLSVGLDDNKVLDRNNGFDYGIYIGDDKRIHFLGKSYPIFNIPKEIIKRELDDMAISGVRIDRDLSKFNGNYESNAFQLNIEIPESVDIVLDTKGYPEIDIENDLIKNNVYLNSPYNIDSIKYDGEIKEFIIDATKEKDNIISLTTFNDPKNIKRMDINVNRGTYFIGNVENGKIADELFINVGKSKNEMDEDFNTKDIVEPEDSINEYLVENVLRSEDENDNSSRDYGNVESRIDELKNESKKADNNKALLEKFSKEINRSAENEKNNDNYIKEIEDFYKEFDFSMSVNKGMADKVTINAPEANVRVELAKKFNPKMDLKTKNGIDMRYYLIDKVSADKIQMPNTLKDYSGSIYDYINKIDSKHSIKSKEMLPTIAVNAEYARITESIDNE